LTFIVKSMAYSHFLMASLVLYTLEYAKGENVVQGSMDIEIDIGEEYREEERRVLLRADPRRFLLQVFTEFLNRKMTACYKYILEFCGKSLTANASVETCSMVMLLSTRMFIEGSLSTDLLKSILFKLVRISQREQTVRRNLFDFVMIVWQRNNQALTN